MGIILRFAILVLLFIDLSAQIITFKRTLPIFPVETYEEITAVSITQTKDNKYLVGALQNRYPVIIKLNEFGNAEFIKRFDYKVNQFSRNIFVESDDSGNYYICVNKPGSPVLYKFNSFGAELWNKILGVVSGTWISMVKRADNSLLISTGKPDSLFILNIDLSGNTIWQKSYALWGSLTEIKISKDNSFYICSKSLGSQSAIHKFSSNADLIRSVYPPACDTFIPVGEGVCTHGTDYLYLMQNLEDTYWTRISLPGKHSASCETDDGNFIFAGKTITKVNSKGTKIWTIENYGFNFSFIRQTNDGGFVLLNGKDIYKTDSNGICKWINLNRYLTIPAGKLFEINWSDDNINNVEIQYSTDNGKNWFYIAQNLIDSGKYAWNVPEMTAENVMLKITDSENPLISDSTTFSISYNLKQNYIAINNIKMWMNNSGIGSHDFISDGSGFFWPGGESADLPVIFTDGLVWGGLINGQIRVNGSTYRTGLQPGKILKSGVPDNPEKLEYNLWHLRKDWESLPAGLERNIFEYNYNNWPAAMGAPYEDVNNDGLYTREIDKPKIYGDETFWFVANDLDTVTSRYSYGSDPIGLEMQCTVYGYNRTDELGDVVFKKYKIINRGFNTVDSMFLCYFVDPDLGYANDDFVGCDTSLNLGYCYNGDNNDESMYGEAPPAVGYFLLEGTSNPLMSRFSPNMKNISDWYDPYLGNYQGSIEFYNYMNTKKPGGEPLVDPHSGDTVYFALAGDPVNKTGWYEGEGWPPYFPEPADRRMNIVTGPINFAPADTQEVVYAIVLARGTDNINSVKVLKDKVKAVRNFYYHGILNNSKSEKKELIPHYSLQQNYPNPFNPSTTISYSVPEITNVELKVFDVLGKKVITLVNEEKPAGNYQVKFDAENFSSGIYFYRIKAKDYIKTIKMMIIK